MTNLKEYDNFIRFSSLDEKIDKLKEWELIGKKDWKKLISGEDTKIKQILYKGAFVQGETNCEIIGYTTQKTYHGLYEIAVIELNGETHKINPAYLKQMQSKDFNAFSLNEEG